MVLLPGYSQPIQRSGTGSTQTLDCSAACLAGVISDGLMLMLDDLHY